MGETESFGETESCFGQAESFGQTEGFEIDSDEFNDDCQSDDFKFYKLNINCEVDELIIPENLKEDMMWLAGASLYLEDISGVQWKAVMDINENRDLCFKKGWINFVKDHYLSNSEFLLFIYKGSKTFTVRIYDTCTGLERKKFTPPSSPSCMKRKPNFQKKRSPKKFVQDPSNIVIIH